MEAVGTHGAIEWLVLYTHVACTRDELRQELQAKHPTIVAGSVAFNCGKYVTPCAWVYVRFMTKKTLAQALSPGFFDVHPYKCYPLPFISPKAEVHHLLLDSERLDFGLCQILDKVKAHAGFKAYLVECANHSEPVCHLLRALVPGQDPEDPAIRRTTLKNLSPFIGLLTKREPLEPL